MSPFVAAFFLLGLFLANAINFSTVYQWEKFDFIWPSGVDTSNGRIKQNFNPDKVTLQYMAVFGERLFLSLDLKDGIPATLVWLPTSGTSTSSPTLAPFPSWHFHKKDNCDSIQQAKGMETDPDGRLWVLDRGSSKCPSKIWIFDLLNNDKIERVHQFPDAVVSHLFSKRWLRDMVLDKTPDDYLAYIAESESEHIVVYSWKKDKSWSVKTRGKQWVALALSANRKARQLYLRRFYSRELYSVSVSELKNEGGNAAALKLIGKWTGTPYRMLMDSANVLYAAFHNQNYLSKWNIAEPFREQRFHKVGNLGAHWPFTFALDANGILWMTERNETKGETETRHKLLKTEFGISPTASTSAFSLYTIIAILLFVCFLVLSGIVIAWLVLRMRRKQTSLTQISMDNNRAEMSVSVDNAVYDDVGPENTNEEARPENPDEPLYAEVDPDSSTSVHSDYACARNPSPEIYEEPLRLGSGKHQL